MTKITFNYNLAKFIFFQKIHMFLSSRQKDILANTIFSQSPWEKINNETKNKTDKIIKYWKINLHNTLRIIITELISSTEVTKCYPKQVVTNINSILLEEKYPWISLTLKKKIKNWLKEKKAFLEENGLDLKSYIIGKLLETPETFLSSLIKELEIDFYNPSNMEGVGINPNNLKDIPIQAKEAREAWVPNEYNATIWVLKDDKWNIVVNGKIADNLTFPRNDQSFRNKVLDYHPWEWSEIFRTAIEYLIKREEKLYNWPKIKWVHTRPYFIPGGGGGLSIFRDFFLEEWDLVLVPNFRWPNIDWIIINKTKVLPAELDIINKDWTLNFNSLKDSLTNAIEQWRKKVSIYLNFPSNPTWTNLSKNDAEELNNILKTFEKQINIQIILDDPYWAFSIENESKEKLKENKGWYISKLQAIRKLIPHWQKAIPKLTTPLSYYIDTSNNIDIIELWSHGTKEAWVYWLRAWVLRVFTNKNKKDDLEKKLNKAIRETFSMSPSLPQWIISRAILGNLLDWYKPWKQSIQEYLKSLNKNIINYNLDEYIKARTTMLKVIYPKIEKLKHEIVDKCGDFLTPMENIQDWTENTWGFVLNFTLTQQAKNEWLDLEKLRESCLSKWENGIAFTTFKDNVTWEKSMRVSLIAWAPKMFAEILEDSIFSETTGKQMAELLEVQIDELQETLTDSK